MKPLVIFDRDGVLNRLVNYPDEKFVSPRCIHSVRLEQRPESWRQRISAFRTAIATNQPDVSRQKMSSAQLNLINKKVMDYFGIDRVFVCPHDDFQGCECRKPKPGMLLEAITYFGNRKQHSIFVGDTRKDQLAARAAGIQFIAFRPQNTFHKDEVRTVVWNMGSLIDELEEWRGNS